MYQTTFFKKVFKYMKIFENITPSDPSMLHR